MEHGRLIEMGHIATVDQDGTRIEYKMALVIEFSSTDEIRRAIKEGACAFGWGDDQVPNGEVRGASRLAGEPSSAEGATSTVVLED